MKFIFAFLIFVLGLIAYLPNATITPQNSDGTQFVIAAIKDTVVHQPGYPLYSFINKIIAELDPSSVFQNIARSSSVYQSLAALMLFLTGALFTNQLFLVFLGVVSWLFFEPVARTSTDVEVFALHNLIIACVIYLSTKLFLNKDKKLFNTLLLGISWGLGIAHHHTIILWFPLSLVALFTTGLKVDSDKWNISEFLKYLVVFLLPIFLGFCFYLTLLFKSSSNYYPLSPPNNIQELIRFFLRVDFGTFSIGGGSQNTQNYFKYFLTLSLVQIPFLVLSPFVVILKILKSKNLLHISFILSLVLNLLFASAIVFPGETEVVSEWVTRFFGLIAISFLTLYFICLYYYDFLKIKIQLILFTLLLTSLIYTSRISINSSNARDDLIIMQELDAIAEEVPANGVFVTSSDRIAMGLSYLQSVLKKRLDLIVVTPSLLKKKDYSTNLANSLGIKCGLSCNLLDLLIEANNKGRFIGAYQELTPPNNFIAIPVGVVWQWVTPDKAISDQEIESRLKTFCKIFSEKFDRLPVGRNHSKLILERVFLGPLTSFQQYLQQKKDFTTAASITEILNNVKNYGYNDAGLKCKIL